jgi:hypothetical protein
MENQDLQDAQSNDLPVLPVPDELTTLKERADLMGIPYHPNIGVDKLRAKVAAAIDGTPQPTEPVEPIEPEDAADIMLVTGAPNQRPVAAAVVEETPNQRRLRLKKDATALVRIKLSCMNPAKKEWEGEIFTAGNSLIGSVKKFVPFNADEGWHVPRIIFNVIRDRMCQVFITIKDAKGNSVRKGKLIREFNVEVLPNLTEVELAELATQQAMRRAID